MIRLISIAALVCWAGLASAGAPGPEPRLRAPLPRVVFELRGGPGQAATAGGALSYRVRPSFRLGASVDYMAAESVSVSGSVTASHRHCKPTAAYTLEVPSGRTMALGFAGYDFETNGLLRPYVEVGAGILDRDWAVAGTVGTLARLTDWIEGGMAYRVIGSGGAETNHGALLVLRLGW